MENLGIFVVAGVIYFFPTLNAIIRIHHNAMPIALLNLFLGWTFIGWVVALVWSASALKEPPRERETLD